MCPAFPWPSHGRATRPALSLGNLQVPSRETAQIVAAVFTHLVAFRCFKETDLTVASTGPPLHTNLVPGLGGDAAVG